MQTNCSSIRFSSELFGATNEQKKTTLKKPNKFTDLKKKKIIFCTPNGIVWFEENFHRTMKKKTTTFN